MGSGISGFYVAKSAINEAFFDEFLNYKNRINVFYGGAGSGKSHFVIQKIIYKYMKFPNRKGLVIRKVQNTMRDSVFALFLEVLSDWELLGSCRVNKSFLEIELPNGSTFIFKGLDDAEKIKSIAGIDDIIIEEASDIDLDEYSQLNLRLRSSKPYNQIHLMFNPVSKSNWVYKKWFEDREYGEEERKEISRTIILHTTYRDNKFLPSEYIRELEAMKDSNPEYYKIYALGEFATLDKLVFENTFIEDFNYLDLIRENDDIEALFGLDFGYTADPTAFIAVLQDEEDRKLYIYDEFYEKALLNNEIANEIIKRGYRKEIIVADSADGKKTVDELRRLGLPRVQGAKKGPGSVLSGIQYIKQYDIIVHPSCVNTVEELNNYSWKKDKGGEYINEPIDSNNHLMDALRYAVSDGKAKTKIKLFDRRLLGI